MAIGRRQFLLASSTIAGLAAVAARRIRANSAQASVVGLTVDYIDKPLGVESPQPRLSWRIESNRRNVRQSAYRILVASSQTGLQEGRGDLWDSGIVASRLSLGIRYQGRQLTSRRRCWWCVQVWEERNSPPAQSEPSWWEMGLLEAKDWTAQWVTFEDSVTKGDRDAGLHWIWGKPIQEQGTRLFRSKFQLPAPSSAGAVYAVTNDWTWFSQIVRIWIDGDPIAGQGAWDEPPAIAPTVAPASLENWIALKPLDRGEHLIAVEVATPALPSYMADTPFAYGLALLARFDLKNERTLRIGSGPHWKTSSVPDENWYRTAYDDIRWETAREAPIRDYQPWPAQAAVHLRREFRLNKPVLSARLYATALGAYEARLNGNRVGDALLTPEITQYNKRVLYRVYDVAHMLRLGPNVLGLTLGDGWYAGFDGRFPWNSAPRRVTAQLELTLADGSRQVVSTGPGWQAAPSPICRSVVRSGEVYDARLEQPGWDTGEFDSAHWQDAQIAATPNCRLVAHIAPPIRVTQVLKSCAMSEPKPGVYVFDFGQNFAGWCRLYVKGPRDTKVELRFSELLSPSGDLIETYFSMGEPKRDVFILKGDPTGETFEPHFAYRGFRYVEVTGLPAPPTPNSLIGLVVHSDLKVTGQLRANVPLIEQLWRNTVWTQRSNFVGIPTDCPSREQRGYLADAGVYWDAAAFNMDVCMFTARQMDNATDDQAADGTFPDAAPEPRNNNSSFRTSGAPAWADAAIILPWTAWRRYGDISIIERNWDAMSRYVNLIEERNPDYVWKNRRGCDYGDLYEVLSPSDRETPKDLIATAYWAHSVSLLAEMAHAVGRMDEERRLRLLFARVSQAFNKAFVGSNGAVGSGSQTGYTLALKFELLPGEIRSTAAQRLATDIRNRGVALTTGYLGTQFILDVLVDAGFAELAYGLLLRTDYPSWGHMIRNGATTMWENWSGEQAIDHKVCKASQNHFALGSISGFLFRRVAGIDAAAPGFETIVIRPIVDSRVKRAGADYQSILGRISTDWTRLDDGSFRLHVTIPANTSAYIHLPASRRSRVQESGRDVVDRTDFHQVSRLDRTAIIEIGSGTYQFLVSG